MSDRSVCSVCWCAAAYEYKPETKNCECECHMPRYIKPNKEPTYVWLVWTFKNFDMEGRRDIHSVHETKNGAIAEEGVLPRNEEYYYSIEKKELRQ